MKGSTAAWPFIRSCCAVVALVPIGMASAASAEVCLFQEKQSDAYYILGSQVQPQSDVLIAGDCSSSYAALSVQYLDAARVRLTPDRGATTSDAASCEANRDHGRGCTSTE